MKSFFVLAWLLYATASIHANDLPPCSTPDECKAACEKKDAESCGRLSTDYALGDKVEKDPERAKQYKLLECDYSDAYRCLVLGWMYQYGRFGKPEVTQAEIFYRKACDKGDHRGCEFIIANQAGRSPKPSADGNPPPVPPLLCSDPRSVEFEPGSNPPRRKIFPAGQIDLPGKIVKRVEPTYPYVERDMKRSGKVFVEATIDENGTAVDMRILRSDGKPFEDAALAALKQWSFSPPRHCGKPARTYRHITFVFKP